MSWHFEETKNSVNWFSPIKRQKHTIASNPTHCAVHATCRFEHAIQVAVTNLVSWDAETAYYEADNCSSDIGYIKSTLAITLDPQKSGIRSSSFCNDTAVENKLVTSARLYVLFFGLRIWKLPLLCSLQPWLGSNSYGCASGRLCYRRASWVLYTRRWFQKPRRLRGVPKSAG